MIKKLLRDWCHSLLLPLWLTYGDESVFLLIVQSNCKLEISHTVSVTELDIILEQLKPIRVEHQALNQEIDELINNAAYVDQMKIRRLKKRKLFLKDEIVKLESLLIPDLNAWLSITIGMNFRSDPSISNNKALSEIDALLSDACHQCI